MHEGTVRMTMARKSHIILHLKHIPTLPTLSLSIRGLQTRYPTLETTPTPTPNIINAPCPL